MRDFDAGGGRQSGRRTAARKPHEMSLASRNKPTFGLDPAKCVERLQIIRQTEICSPFLERLDSGAKFGMAISARQNPRIEARWRRHASSCGWSAGPSSTRLRWHRGQTSQQSQPPHPFRKHGVRLKFTCQLRILCMWLWRPPSPRCTHAKDVPGCRGGSRARARAVYRAGRRGSGICARPLPFAPPPRRGPPARHGARAN